MSEFDKWLEYECRKAEAARTAQTVEEYREKLQEIRKKLNL